MRRGAVALVRRWVGRSRWEGCKVEVRRAVDQGVRWERGRWTVARGVERWRVVQGGRSPYLLNQRLSRKGARWERVREDVQGARWEGGEMGGRA